MSLRNPTAEKVLKEPVLTSLVPHAAICNVHHRMPETAPNHQGFALFESHLPPHLQDVLTVVL